LATANGTVRVPSPAKAIVYTLKKQARPIAKGATATLRQKLSAPTRRAIRRALRRGRPVTVKVRITVADAAENVRTLKRQVELRL